MLCAVLLCCLAVQGWRVITSSVAQKPRPFSTIKSNNYLPNALAQLEGEDAECDAVSDIYSPACA